VKKGNVLVIKSRGPVRELKKALVERGWEVVAVKEGDELSIGLLPDLIIIDNFGSKGEILYRELGEKFPGTPVFCHSHSSHKGEGGKIHTLAIPCPGEDLGKMAETMLYAHRRGGRPIASHEGTAHYERALEVLYEINSPLSVVLANASLLLADEKNVRAEARSLVKEIRLAVENIVVMNSEFGYRKSHVSPPCSEIKERRSSREKPRILVVDDEKSVCELLSRVLGADFDVVLAHDGRDALKRAEEEHFDLFIVDLHLPHMKGIDILKTFKKKKKVQRPFIVITGYLDDEDALEALTHGARGCFYKPFDIEEIRAFVRQVLS